MKHIHHAPHFDLLYDDVVRDGVVEEFLSGRMDFFDPFLKSVYDEWVKPDSIVVEVGAHVGTHTLYLSKRAKRVIAFEPQRAVFLQLCGNLWLNDCRNVEPVNTAILAKECVAKPNVHESAYWGSTAKASISFSETGNPDDFGSVPGRTLDSYAIKQVDFLKIDAEWNDFQVALGGQQTIARCRPIIAFEEGNEEIDKWRELLTPLGYGITRLARSNFLCVPASRTTS